MNFLNQIKSIGKQLGVILLYFIVSIMLVEFLSPLLGNSNKIYQEIANILFYLLLLLCFIIIFRKTIVPNFYDFKKNGKKYLKETYQYYIYGLIIMFVSNLIITNFIGMATNEAANRSEFLDLPVSTCLAFVIFAPITEELMTRVILKDTFKNKWIYVILSGLIFGSLHVLLAIESNLWELLDRPTAPKVLI